MASSSSFIELIASSVKLVLLSKSCRGYNVMRLRVVCGEEEDLERGDATF